MNRVWRDAGGSAMREDPIDITGLPIHYVNKIVSLKLKDGSVAVVCGFEMLEKFTPLYVTVSPASVAIEDGRTYVEVAERAGETSH